MKPPRIPHVAWREGRPRFVPSKTLRARGHRGHDLRHEDDRWFTLGEAMDWSAEFARKLKREPTAVARDMPLTAAGIYIPLTVEALSDLYFSLDDNPEFALLAEKTRRDYRGKMRAIELHCPEVWVRSADALTREICKGMGARLMQKSGVAMAKGSMLVFGAMLSWAIGCGKVKLPVNPAHGLKLKSPKPRLRAGEPEEIDHIVETADAMGWPEMGDMVMLGVWTGQRQADRLKATRDMVKDGRLDLCQNKTEARVSPPLAPDLKARLKAAEQRRRKAGKMELQQLVVDEQRWTPMLADFYAKRFRKLIIEAAKTMPSVADLRDQDLRDTAVTWLARAGVELQDVCAITGHSFQSANNIWKHYLALHTEMADRGIRKMHSWYSDKKKKAAAEARRKQLRVVEGGKGKEA